MKTDSQTRLECMKLAAMLAASKAIAPGNVLKEAEAFYQWCICPPPSARD